MHLPNDGIDLTVNVTYPEPRWADTSILPESVTVARRQYDLPGCSTPDANLRNVPSPPVSVVLLLMATLLKLAPSHCVSLVHCKVDGAKKDKVLGSTRAASVKVEEDAEGLLSEATILTNGGMPIQPSRKECDETREGLIYC